MALHNFRFLDGYTTFGEVECSFMAGRGEKLWLHSASGFHVVVRS